jgi:hypothetical protein
VERNRSVTTVIVVIALLAAAPGARAEAPLAAGLPLVDLAGETARQVVVDREAGQYLGHPTTVLLDDGKTILCVYPKGHGKGAIVYKRSEDGMDNTYRDDCAYPGLERLPDGTFVTTTYGHWTAGEPPYVVSVRFTLAELDARRGRQP